MARTFANSARLALWQKGLAILLAAALCWITASLLRAAEEDRGVLANLISKALSSPQTQVSIGAVDGALSSNATISNIVLSDSDGPWLKIDKVRLVWNRLALFSRRLEVDQLQIGKLEFLRRPPRPDASAPKADDAPLLPDLPVKVIVKQFGIDQMSLGAPVVGAPAQLTIAGAATLGPPSEGLDLHLDAHRLDAAGAFAARLVFVPQSKALTATLKFNEPAGGLLAHFANIPGLPPVRFDLDGSGVLDAFKATLGFEAGPTIGANGDVDLHREGAGRRLKLSLRSRLEGLLPVFVGAIFAGETALEGDVALADSGALDIATLRLDSAAARLDVAGGVSAEQNLDLKITAAAIPHEQGEAAAGVEIGKLELTATAKGPLKGPEIAAHATAEQLRVPQGRIGKFDADFDARPDGAVDDPATRIALSAKAEASGVALADRALGEAVGSSAQMTLRGAISGEGEAQIDEFHLAASSLDATYRGLIGAKVLHGQLVLHAPDLARFAGLSTLALKGAADLTADLDGIPRERTLRAALDGRATEFATGVAPVDGLAGGRLTLAGAAELLAKGGFGFENLVLTGAHGTMRLNGSATEELADVKAAIDAPEARYLDPRISGKAQLSAALTGALNRLGGTIEASLRDGQLMGRPTPGIAVQATGRDLTGLIDADATLTGAIDRKPLDGAFHIARKSDSGWALDRLALNLGSAHLSGDLAVDADDFAAGRLAFAAANLDDLSPLVLTKLSGAIDAKMALTAPDKRQNVSIVARSAKFAVAQYQFEGLDADLAVTDLRGRPGVEGAARLARATLAGQTIADLNLAAKGAPGGSDLDFSALVRGLAVKTKARLIAENPPRLDLSSLTIQGAGQKIAMTEPASIIKTPDGVIVNKLALSANGGRITFDGRVGETLDVKFAAAAVPLTILDLVQPGLALNGALDASAAMSGPASAPSGEWRLKITRLTTPQTRSAALAPIDVSGSGRLGAGRATLEARVNAGAAGDLRLSGSAPLSMDGDLDLRVQGKVNAAAANGAIGDSARRLTGVLAIDVAVRGSPSKPRADGSANLSDGGFIDSEQGVRLEKITGRISARGDQITIERFDASTPNGGSLKATGQARLDPAAGFPGAVRISGHRAQLVSNDIVAATADLSLDVSGALAQSPTVRGRIDIDSMDISVPERLSGAIRPLDGVRHVNPGPTARARLAIDAKSRAGGRRGAPFSANLDLTVSTPGRIFVRGRGLNAELGGDLKVGGTTANPQIRGGFNLRSGSLSLLAQKLNFTRGDVVFHGDVIPELDFLAETTAADITARIAVTGPASKPTFAITSIPSLPQDEILSRILFQKASGNLSGFQALELANAVSTLSGGNDSFERLRKSLGVDSLDIGSGPSGGPTVGASRAINDRISIGVTAGAKSEDSSVSVNLDVTRHLRLQGGVDASGGSSVGVGAQWEYK